MRPSPPHASDFRPSEILFTALWASFDPLPRDIECSPYARFLRFLSWLFYRRPLSSAEKASFPQDSPWAFWRLPLIESSSHGTGPTRCRLPDLSLPPPPAVAPMTATQTRTLQPVHKVNHVDFMKWLTKLTLAAKLLPNTPPFF